MITKGLATIAAIILSLVAVSAPVIAAHIDQSKDKKNTIENLLEKTTTAHFTPPTIECGTVEVDFKTSQDGMPFDLTLVSGERSPFLVRAAYYGLMLGLMDTPSNTKLTPCKQYRATISHITPQKISWKIEAGTEAKPQADKSELQKIKASLKKLPQSIFKKNSDGSIDFSIDINNGMYLTRLLEQYQNAPDDLEAEKLLTQTMSKLVGQTITADDYSSLASRMPIYLNFKTKSNDKTLGLLASAIGGFAKACHLSKERRNIVKLTESYLSKAALKASELGNYTTDSMLCAAIVCGNFAMQQSLLEGLDKQSPARLLLEKHRNSKIIDGPIFAKNSGSNQHRDISKMSPGEIANYFPDNTEAFTVVKGRSEGRSEVKLETKEAEEEEGETETDDQCFIKDGAWSYTSLITMNGAIPAENAGNDSFIITGSRSLTPPDNFGPYERESVTLLVKPGTFSKTEIASTSVDSETIVQRLQYYGVTIICKLRKSDYLEKLSYECQPSPNTIVKATDPLMLLELLENLSKAQSASLSRRWKEFDYCHSANVFGFQHVKGMAYLAKAAENSLSNSNMSGSLLSGRMNSFGPIVIAHPDGRVDFILQSILPTTQNTFIEMCKKNTFPMANLFRIPESKRTVNKGATTIAIKKKDGVTVINLKPDANLADDLGLYIYNILGSNFSL